MPEKNVRKPENNAFQDMTPKFVGPCSAHQSDYS